jgi:Secretion system C-terminal sorting domain
MKKLIIFSFTLLFYQLKAVGQTVVSSCTAPDSIVAKYRDDIDAIVLDRTKMFNTSYKDSVAFDPLCSDTVRKVLMAVYNAHGIPARDTVIDTLNIHTSYKFDLKHFLVSADTNLPWMHQLKNHIFPTGYIAIDSLIDKYHFHFDPYPNQPFNEVYFVSDSNWNLLAMDKIFESIPGVNYAMPTFWSSLEGNTISLLKDIGHIDVIFSQGYDWYWVFRVYDNCSVEFIGSSNDPRVFYPTSVHEVAEKGISIYPNPVTDYLLLSSNDIRNYRIYALDGRQLMEGSVADNKIDVKSLPSGNYVIRFTTSKGDGNLLFVKQ